ncbi:DUF5519 family protein [Lichenicola cladoniae]|uniref:DUF5519 family protein n=1 Tax=Lichenicola cladoniae TaxID=1484109 RepID=A0A6M8HQW5_9PROT|nr:luciferase family protein [Lichenicola cladoniae]NPD69041.1 DUF5519 family protein [Acetobacteraceae bacterium]QKE90873.1 DUF5519 family protein [Lichenicola cladoniae]
MTERAEGTLARTEKGPVCPPPVLDEHLDAVARIVRSWPGVISTTHWNPFRPSEVDGIDFYVGEEELGHIHLDGSIHLATSPSLGKTMVDEGVARPFRYQQGWVEQQVQRVGADAAIALFQRNYGRLAPAA